MQRRHLRDPGQLQGGAEGLAGPLVVAELPTQRGLAMERLRMAQGHCRGKHPGLC